MYVHFCVHCCILRLLCMHLQSVPHKMFVECLKHRAFVGMASQSILPKQSKAQQTVCVRTCTLCNRATELPTDTYKRSNMRIKPCQVVPCLFRFLCPTIHKTQPQHVRSFLFTHFIHPMIDRAKRVRAKEQK